MSITGPDIVRLDEVSKHFTVRKDNSLKDRIVHFGRLGRDLREDFVAVDDVSLRIQGGHHGRSARVRTAPASRPCSSSSAASSPRRPEQCRRADAWLRCWNSGPDSTPT